MSRETDNSHRYDDIIHLPHHVSETHPRMLQRDRAAQFAPFAALTGLDNAMQATAQSLEEDTIIREEELC